MYCLVDFRNRPQLEYSFRTREKAGEYLKKIKNNPLGVTAVYADGRREYFENGLPTGYFRSSGRSVRVIKGFQAGYSVRKLSTLDGLRKQRRASVSANFGNWKKKSVFPLFMLGNRKFYAGLAIAALIAFSSSWYFENQYGEIASARTLQSAGGDAGLVAGASDSKIEDGENGESLRLADESVIMNLLGKIEEARQDEFETELLRYIKGRPMEDMAPYIAKQPRIVAAFLVGIAMKESKFGTYSPKLGGRDCHNYWGFKGGGTTTSGGYTCFATPEQAVQVVGKRIARLVDGGRTNPSSMIVWKCGSSCSWDRPENVRKWIADVGVNFYKINSGEKT